MGCIKMIPFEINNKVEVKISICNKITLGISEFLGTLVLVFVSCMGCVPGIRNQEVLVQQSALSSGLACLVAIFLFGHISGAHINPISTVCAVIVKKIPLNLMPIYFMGQILGAIVGYGLLVWITPKEFMQNDNVDVHGICSTIPSPRITIWQAVIIEMILSLILTFANCSCWDHRNKNNQETIPLRFGFLIATLIMVAGPYTGASMNPAKSFAPALWNNDWKNHWIYWVSPLSAAILGSVFYKILFLRNNQNNEVVIQSNTFE